MENRPIVFVTGDRQDLDAIKKLGKTLTRLSGKGQFPAWVVHTDEPELVGTEFYDGIEKHFYESTHCLAICSAAGWDSEHLAGKITGFSGPSSNLLALATDDQGVELANQAGLGKLLDYRTRPFPNDGRAAGDNFQHLLAAIAGISPERAAEYGTEVFKKQIRTMALAVAAVVAVMASFAGWQWYGGHVERAEQNTEARRQQADAYIQTSLHYRNLQRELEAAHWAAQAYHLSPQQDTRDSLMNYLPEITLRAILPHPTPLVGAILNGTEDLLVSWGEDNRLYRWNTDNYTQAGAPLPHTQWVIGALFTADDRQLISWSEDSTARIWNPSTGQLIGTLPHEDGVIGAQLDRQGNLLTWSRDGSARIWDLNTQKVLQRFSHREGWVQGALLSGDEKKLFTWSSDSTARLWSVEKGSALSGNLVHRGDINGALFIQRDQFVVTWSSDGLIHIWDANDGQQRSSGDMRHEEDVKGALIGQGGRKLLSWGRDGKLILWDIPRRKPDFAPMAHDGWVLGALFFENENRILSWSFDNTARVWNARTGESLGKPMYHSSGPLGRDAGVLGAEVHPLRPLALTWGEDNTARIWDLSRFSLKGLPLQHAISDSLNREVLGGRFFQHGNRIVTWGNDHTCRIWEIQDEEELKKMADVFPEAPRRKLTAWTGTRLNLQRETLESLSPEEWSAGNP